MVRFFTFLFILFVGPAAFAQGKKPDSKPTSQKESHPLHDAKEKANNALISLDQGVHEAGSAVKEGANQALEAVDHGVHKVIGSKKE